MKYIAEIKYAIINGEGSPHEPIYSDVLEALYVFFYTLKMLPKKVLFQRGIMNILFFHLKDFGTLAMVVIWEKILIKISLFIE